MSSKDGWDYSTDILVVGSGAGAMTSSVVAANHGADVIVIEKSGLMGGTSATSGGGIWIPCNHHMAGQGVTDTTEEAFGYIKALTKDEVSDEKIHAYVREAPRMLKYMEEQSEVKFRAVPYADYHPEIEGGKPGCRTCEPEPVYETVLGDEIEQLRPMHQGSKASGEINWTMIESRPMITRKPGWIKTYVILVARYWFDIGQRLKTSRDGRLTLGNALIARLRQSMVQRNVPLWLNTPMKELIKENGRIIGVVAEKDGRPIRIEARKAIVLGAGGFERNQEMREKYLPQPTKAEWTASNPDNTGDAIKGGIEIGAKTDIMDWAWWAPGILVPGEDRARPLFAERALPGCMIVNKAGKRFMNEAASYQITGGQMYTENSDQEPTIPAFIVFDANFRKKYPIGPLLPGYAQKDSAIPDRVMSKLKIASSLDDLARQLGVDADGLKDSAQKMTNYARAGKDLDFQRGESLYDQYYGDPSVEPNCCLAPINTAPFYGIELVPSDIGTKGGLLTDEYARVLDEDNRPIEGLYAVGNTAASVMGRTYPGAGATIGPAMTFGYVAARHIMGINE